MRSGSAALAGLLFGLLARTAPGAEPGVHASMACALEAGTGRLLCTVTFVATPDRVLSWSDALVVAAPPAARPLKARVASARGAADKVVIGFVLVGADGGRIEVLARAVSCPKAPRHGACLPATRRVSYELERPAG